MTIIIALGIPACGSSGNQPLGGGDDIPGALDTSFDTDGKLTLNIGSSDDIAYSVAIQSDDKIVVAGYTGPGDFALVRFNTDGSLDSTFGTDGIVTTTVGSGGQAASVAIQQSDGKIVAAGYSNNGIDDDFAVVRYNTDGSLDTSFDTDGIVTTPIGAGDDRATSLAIQSNGKIVVAGYYDNGTNEDIAIARYNTNGALDTSFDTDGKAILGIGPGHDVANGVAIQSDSTIVVVGYTYNGSDDDIVLARFTTSGGLDTGFDTDGIVTTDLGSSNEIGAAIAIQNNGKIVITGYTDSGSSPYDFALARYNTDGSLDTTFDTDGLVTTDFDGSNNIAHALGIQSDGKIVVAGDSPNDFEVNRYDTDGSLDTTFGTDGIASVAIGPDSDRPRGLAFQGSGKIVVAGASFVGSNWEFSVVRISP